MIDLVKVVKQDVFCDSDMVAKKFGKKHAYVVRIISGLIDELGKIRVISSHPTAVLEKRVYRGNEYSVYLMDEEFFTLLSMRFKGQKALEWQIKFTRAFKSMKEIIMRAKLNKENVAFMKARSSGKELRLLETNIVKEFVEYATDQGSKSAKFYYKHITDMTYKALGLMDQRIPNFRDSLNTVHIFELGLAETKAGELLKHYMELGRNYKDIYQSVKDDLIKYCSSMVLSFSDEEKKLKY